MKSGKTLYLVRHAKSSWSHAGLSDVDRPLNKRGLHDASEMGRRMKARACLPEIIICSPATRARETLENMELGVEEILFDDCIYGAPPGGLLNIIQTIPNRYPSAMLIGHNPSITLLAGRLSGRPIDHMPTGAIAVIGLDSDRWSKAGSCAAEWLDFDYPKKRME